MRHPTPSNSEVKRRYAIRRRRQYLATIPLVVALVIIQISLRVTGTEEKDWLPPYIWRPALQLALLSVIVFSVFNWRCPRCNVFLAPFSFKHCSNCGVELR